MRKVKYFKNQSSLYSWVLYTLNYGRSRIRPVLFSDQDEKFLEKNRHSYNATTQGNTVN